MLVLFTDYGWADPYVGQVKAVLHGHAPGVPVVDLLHGVPAYNAHAGAHLLDALRTSFPLGTVFLCVVDPGVGGGREVVLMEADGCHYVGPDNGLLSVVAARARQVSIRRIVWRPEAMSHTFHGRDQMAVVAAELAAGVLPPDKTASGHDLAVQFDAADLPRILYVDHFGNAWTGLRGQLLEPDAKLWAGKTRLDYRRTFMEADKGQAFWHINSSGLVEVAANRANAAALLGLSIGDLVKPDIAPDSRLH